MWCDAFRKPGFHASVKTNNGVESLNKLFKFYYNNLRTDKTVTGLCLLLQQSFLPDAINRYTINNVKFSSEFKLYDQSIPLYLHNRPQWFVKHCMQRLHSAANGFKKEDIQQQNEVSFLVKAQGSEELWYQVLLSNDSQFPTCECIDFKQHFLPCKHMFTVLTMMPGYLWDCLPENFCNSPLFNVDESFFSELNQNYEVKNAGQQMNV